MGLGLNLANVQREDPDSASGQPARNEVPGIDLGSATTEKSKDPGMNKGIPSLRLGGMGIAT